jgi:hypothetical protein
MTIKEFIQASIEGGWDRKNLYGETSVYPNGEIESSVEAILINPKAWQAVGKVEGWEAEGDDCGNCEHTNKSVPCPECPYDEYRERMHRFIDYLQEGDTIDTALIKSTE